MLTNQHQLTQKIFQKKMLILLVTNNFDRGCKGLGLNNQDK